MPLAYPGLGNGPNQLLILVPLASCSIATATRHPCRMPLLWLGGLYIATGRLLTGRLPPTVWGRHNSVSARFPVALTGTHEIQLSSYAYLFRHVERRQEAGLEIRSLIKTKVPKIEFHA